METLGLMSAVVIGASVLVGAAVVLVNMPDINRYRRLKKM